MTSGLLDDLRVVDLSLWQPGHTATQLLADLGADVLKVEPPGGDRMRGLPDRFANFNGYKRSLVLDLKTEAGKARLLDLAVEADVLVEGFRPGVGDRLGAGYERLSGANPRLVYCSITGFGQFGPLAGEGGHEFNYQAYGGAFSFPPGGTPLPAGALIGDQGGGMTAAFAILAAVHGARRTGRGERIDVSLTDVMVSWTAPMAPIGEELQSRAENPGMGVYRTADGEYVVLGVHSEDYFWDALCLRLGLPSFVGLSHGERIVRSEELSAGLQSRIARSTRSVLLDELAAAGVPIAPILTRAEAVDHPHFAARGVIAKGPAGERRLAHPVVYQNHPARGPGPAPALGDGGERGFREA